MDWTLIGARAEYQRSHAADAEAAREQERVRREREAASKKSETTRPSRKSTPPTLWLDFEVDAAQHPCGGRL